MAKALIREGVGGAMWIAPWRDGATALAEEARKAATDVAAFGLSPDDYVAVVSTELGISGKVNRNGRIYPTDRFVLENMRLAADIKRGAFSPAEAGHPEGMATLNVAARLMEITFETEGGKALNLGYDEARGTVKVEAGEKIPRVVKAVGKIAFLRTSQGEDAFTLYKAGMPLGMSSVSYGEAVPAVLDAKNPHTASNPDFTGRNVDIIEAQELVRYDVVVDPSAGTYLRAMEEARAAFNALRETTNIPIPTPAVSATKGDPMDLEKLKAEHPALLKQIAEAAVADAFKGHPLASLAEGDQRRLAAVSKALFGESSALAGGAMTDDALTAKVSALVAPIKAENDATRARLTTVEEQLSAAKAAQKKAEEATKAAQAEADRLKAEAAERDAKEARVKALDEAVNAIHKNLRVSVREHVEAQIAAGTLKDPAAIKTAVQGMADFAAKVSKVTAESVVGATADAGAADRGADPGEAKPTTAGAASGGALTFEQLVERAAGAAPVPNA